MSVRAVCFDLGGVLVRICSTWKEALTSAQVQSIVALRGDFHECQAFNLYQGGDLDELTYLESLCDFLAVTTTDVARNVHNGILIEPYDGTLELVLELEAKGVLTGCLSNTNALHWEEMMGSERFPAIARLAKKTASHLVGASKPDPAIYRAFEQETGLAPEEILNFDDVPEYVEAAKSAGWNSVLIDRDGDTSAQMRASLKSFGLL